MARSVCTQQEMQTRAANELYKRNQRNDINQMMTVSYVDCSAEARTLELIHQMADWEINIMNTMHGGLISFLLDATMAITSRAYTGDSMTPTLDMNVQFLRAVKAGAEVHTKATISHVGRSIINLTALLWTDDVTQPCATASGTFFRADSRQ